MWRIAAALTPGPLLACVVLLWVHADAFAISRGDVATIELRVLHALDLQQTLGPYSRFEVSHPGPLLFYVLAPFHALSGGAAGSMYVVAAGINLAACIGLVAVGMSRAQGAVPRAAWLLGVAGLLALLVRAHWPLALATPWNPYVTILPFALLLVLTAAADARARGWIVAMVVLHAFVAQTHAMYLLPATAALGLGVAWRASAHRRELLLGAVTTIVLWLPPVLDAIAGSGNLQRLLTVAGEHQLSMGEVAGILVDRIGFGSPVVLVLVVAALVYARVRLRAEPSSFRARLVLVAIVQLAATTLVLERLDAPRSYLTAWVWTVAFVVWLAVAWALLPSEAPRRFRHAPIVVAAIGVVASGVHQLSETTHRLRELVASTEERTADVVRLVADYEAWRDGSGGLLVSRTPAHWHVFAAIVLQLHARDRPFVVEEKWRHMLGDAIPIADGPMPRIELHDRDGTLMLLPEPDVPVRAWVVDAVGTEGDVALLLDGDIPRAGAKPTEHDAVRVPEDGWITLRLQSPADRLDLTVTGDAWLRIEGSANGVDFAQIGVPARAGRNLRTRTLELWPIGIEPIVFLRVRPIDGPCHVAELGPLARSSLSRGRRSSRALR